MTVTSGQLNRQVRPSGGVVLSDSQADSPDGDERADQRRIERSTQAVRRSTNRLWSRQPLRKPHSLLIMSATDGRCPAEDSETQTRTFALARLRTTAGQTNPTDPPVRQRRGYQLPRAVWAFIRPRYG